MTFVHAGLEYQLAGRDGGFPVVVHHGLVGSAAVSPLAADLANEVGIQLISLARPGYGRSVPREMASISDWPQILVPLLDHLGVQRYSVWGVSAGAPYAYSLAAEASDRVAAVAITSGLGHIADQSIVEHYNDENQTVLGYFRTESETAVSKFWEKSLEASLAQHLETAWEPVLRSALANGAAGPGREAVLQQRDWGYAFGDISCPVRLWHSPDDQMVPYSTAIAIAALIPNAQLHDQADPDHRPSETTVRAALDFLSATAN